MIKTILAVQGASTEVVQALLHSSSQRWAADGARIVGVIETPGMGPKTSRLQDLVSGHAYDVYQDLGSGSTACRLMPAGIMDACEAVERQIAAGCDLVVLSKFGKLEARRNGLISAFGLAVDAGVPILTAVSPTFAEQWALFAGGLAAYAPANRAALDAWWHRVGPLPEPNRHLSGPSIDTIADGPIAGHRAK